MNNTPLKAIKQFYYECCVFEEPRNWVERHGFEYGPFEEWSACPNCLSPDYSDEYTCVPGLDFLVPIDNLFKGMVKFFTGGRI